MPTDRADPGTMATAVAPEGMGADLRTEVVDLADLDPNAPAEIIPVPDARDDRIAALEAMLSAANAMIAELQPERPWLAGALKEDEARGPAVIRSLQAYRGMLATLVATSGLPPRWRRVLFSVVPTLARTAAQLDAAMDPEAAPPLSSAGLRLIVERASRDFGEALFATFTRDAP